MKNAKPLTILFDANPLMVSRTGVGHYTAGLVAAIAAKDPNVRLVGYYFNFLGRKQPPQSPRAGNIMYRPIYHMPGPLVNLLRRFNILIPVELLALVKADFVLYPNFLGLPSLFKAPSAPVIHDMMYHDHPEWGSDKNVRDLNRFVPGTLQRSSFAIAVSKFTSSRLVDVYGYDERKIVRTFIPPVDVPKISDRAAQRKINELKLDKPYMLFVATLEPRKNVISLLEAYKLLPAATRNAFSLVLAGKMDWKYQETKERMEAMQAEGFDVRYLGYIDNDTRSALYQHASLLVLASYYEGFGMQQIEALQYGIPSAVSDIPVFREIGGTGQSYFNHLDPKDIARVVEACLHKPRPDSASMQAAVDSMPTWPEVAGRVLQAIRNAVSGKE